MLRDAYRCEIPISTNEVARSTLQTTSVPKSTRHPKKGEANLEVSRPHQSVVSKVTANICLNHLTTDAIFVDKVLVSELAVAPLVLISSTLAECHYVPKIELLSLIQNTWIVLRNKIRDKT